MTIDYLRKYKISQKEAHTVHYSHTVQYGILKIAEKWQVRNMLEYPNVWRSECQYIATVIFVFLILLVLRAS